MPVVQQCATVMGLDPESTPPQAVADAITVERDLRARKAAAGAVDHQQQRASGWWNVNVPVTEEAWLSPQPSRTHPWDRRDSTSSGVLASSLPASSTRVPTGPRFTLSTRFARERKRE